MSLNQRKQPKSYKDGRTKQAYKDECDISKIMARAEKTGTISHLQKYEGVYADYSDYDFHEQTRQLTRGREMFDELPGEIRREFGQSPQAFFDFVNDPVNKDKLRDILPGLAAPGTQRIRVTPETADQMTASAVASEPPASETTPPEVDPTSDPAEPDTVSA